MRTRQLPKDTFLATAEAEEVLTVLMPSIRSALSTWGKREHLAIVVRDPTDPYSMLLEGYLGDQEEWEHPYLEIAHAKAYLCVKHDCDSGDLIEHAPFLLEGGDVVFPGGIFRDGLVVACSGVQSHFDIMFAEWIASALLAVARDRMDLVKKEDITYMGEGANEVTEE